ARADGRPQPAGRELPVRARRRCTARFVRRRRAVGGGGVAVSLKHDAARGLKWTSLATLFSSALNTVQLVVLGWLLASPDEFGLMAMVMLPIGLGQACADLTTGIVQRAADERQRSSLFWANLLLGLLVALVIAATAPLAAEVF